MAGSALIGNLAVNLALETAAFQRGANIAEKRASALGGKMQDLGTKITKIGAGLTLGVTAPLMAFGKASFTAASDAAELDAAFGETFGGLTKSMDAWAVSVGNSMGRSTREIKEGANTFGLYFNQAAKTREEAAKMSQTFTVLAQDLASFHNTDVETAITALRSGLSGEAEPMRKFGVFLSEAAVNAKAAEMGIASLGQKLTDEQKIAARYAIIMEKTASAQGDVARTSGSTANQIRASKAAWEELQINIGTKLLPALTPLITALGGVLEKFNQLSPTMQTWVVGAGAVAAAIGPIMLGLGPLLIAFGKLLPLLVSLGPVIATFGKALIGLAIAGGPITVVLLAAGALYLAFKNWDKIEPIVRNMVNAIRTWLVDKLNAVWDSAKAKIDAVKNKFRDLYQAVVGNSYIPDMVDGIGRSMAELQKIMVDPALSATEKVGHAFQSLAGMIGDLFGHKAGGIISSLGNLALALAPLFGGKPSMTSNVSTGAIGMAHGGSGVFGGRAGVDRNVLSLNGSPIARVSKGERFQVSPANSNGAMVRIVPSPYFDVVVDGRASNVAAPMVGQAAILGAGGGAAAVARRQARTLP